MSRPSPPEHRRGWWLALGLLALLTGSVGGDGAAVPARRIVAIGDVHGAFDPLVSILRQAGLVDERNRWSGGDAVLVQTGDMVDRGSRTIKVLELLMRLQKEAPEHGGEVVVLLGNHELLNLLGDWRDVTPAIVDDLVDERSEIRRKLAWRDHQAALKRRVKLLGADTETSAAIDEATFLAQTPPGMVEYREAMSPSGRYGAWLRTLPAVVKRGEVIFVHGGLSEALAGQTLGAIDARVRGEIARLDEARAWLHERKLVAAGADAREMRALVRGLVARDDAEPLPPAVSALLEISDWWLVRADGPFWFRGYAEWSEEEGAARLAPVLEGLGARHVVVGHTPQGSKSIRSRFGGAVFLIDTGMLETVYRGRPAALEIVGERFKAIYLGEEQVLLDPANVSP